MSEAWHQHLANLSWWEQIDRFFFPSKYSCTITGPQPVEIIIITIFTIVIASVIVLAWIHFASKTQQEKVTQ